MEIVARMGDGHCIIGSDEEIGGAARKYLRHFPIGGSIGVFDDLAIPLPSPGIAEPLLARMFQHEHVCQIVDDRQIEDQEIEVALFPDEPCRVRQIGIFPLDLLEEGCLVDEVRAVARIIGRSGIEAEPLFQAGDEIGGIAAAPADRTQIELRGAG